MDSQLRKDIIRLLKQLNVPLCSETSLTGETLTNITPIKSGSPIASYQNEAGAVQVFNETITYMAIVGDSLNYTNEEGTVSSLDLSAFTQQARIVSGFYTQGTGVLTLVRDDNSTVLIDISQLGNSTVTSQSGHTIATHTSSTGIVVNINETITNLTVDGNILTYVNESGVSSTLEIEQGARIVSGTYNEITGLITLVRDDLTTVTVDLGEIVPVRSVVTDTIVGHLIATHDDGTGLEVPINETITSLALSGVTLTYTDEAGVETPLDLSALTEDINLAVIVSGSIDGNILTLVRDDDSTITIDLGDVIPAIGSISDVVTGNLIATFDNGLGTQYPIYETVTNLTLISNTLRYTNEAGTVIELDLAQYVGDSRIVSGELVGTDLILTRDDLTTVTIDMAAIFPEVATFTLTVPGHQIGVFDNGVVQVPVRETITDMFLVGTELRYNREDGTLATVELSDLFEDTNLPRIVSGSYATGILTLTRDDATVINIVLPLGTLTDTVTGHLIGNLNTDIVTPIYETITSLELVGSNLVYTNEAGGVVSIPLDTVGSTQARIVTAEVVNGELVLTRDDSTTVTADLQLSEVTDTITGHLIANHSSQGVTTPINETITVLSLTGTILTYVNEAGVEADLDLSDLTENVNIATIVSGEISGDTLILTRDDGSIITVTLNGFLPTTSLLTNLIAGNRIATHNNGLGTEVDINETITSLTFLGTVLTYNSESGSSTIDLTSLNTNLPRIIEGEYANNVLTLTRDDSSIILINLPNTQNVPSVFSNTITGHRIGTHVAGGITIDVNETVTNLTLGGTTLTYFREDGTTSPIDLSGFGPRPRIVSGSVTGTILTLLRDDSSSIPINLSSLVSPSVVTLLNTSTNLKPIAQHVAGGVTRTISETITSLSYAGTTLTYVNESGLVTPINLSALNRARIVSGAYASSNLTLTRDDASTIVIGIPPSTITGTVPGHLIANHTNSNGLVTPIRETVTTLALAGNVLTYTNENGTATPLTLPTTTDTFVTGGTYSSGTLLLTRNDGASINISLPPSTISNLVAGNPIATHVSSTGVSSIIRETITNLTRVGDELRYTNEAGILQTIPLTVTDRFLSAGVYTEGNLVLTVTGAPTLTIPIPQSVITNTQAGKRIATHTSGSGVATDIRETITDIDLTGSVLSYEREDGEITQVTLPTGATSVLTPIVSGNPIATHNNGLGTIQTINETVTSITVLPGNIIRYTNELGVNTNLVYNNNYVNGVTYSQATQYGTGLLTFTRQGLSSLTVNIPSLTPSAITNTIAGNIIATHTNATGVVTNIRESITTLGLVGNVLTYVNEAGTSTPLTLPVGATSSITGTIAGNPIATHNNGLGVSTVIRETITNLSLAGNTLTYLRENGATNVITLPTGATSSVTGTVAGHAIGTHNNGAGTSTVIRETVTSLTISGSTLTYTDENGTANPVTIPSGGGGGGGNVALAVSVNSAIQNYTLSGGSYTFLKATFLTGSETLIIEESLSVGSVLEIWCVRSGGTIEFLGNDIRRNNDAFVDQVSTGAGGTLRFVKQLAGSWVLVNEF